MAGYFATSKKSGARRSVSRDELPVSIALTSMVTSAATLLAFVPSVLDGPRHGAESAPDGRDHHVLDAERRGAVPGIDDPGVRAPRRPGRAGLLTQHGRGEGEGDDDGEQSLHA